MPLSAHRCWYFRSAWNVLPAPPGKKLCEWPVQLGGQRELATLNSCGGMVATLRTLIQGHSKRLRKSATWDDYICCSIVSNMVLTTENWKAYESLCLIHLILFEILKFQCWNMWHAVACGPQDMNGISLSLLPYSSTLAPLIQAPVASSAWPKAVSPQFPEKAPVKVKDRGIQWLLMTSPQSTWWNSVATCNVGSTIVNPPPVLFF